MPGLLTSPQAAGGAPGCSLALPSRPASCFLQATCKMPQIRQEQSILLEEVLLGEIRGCLICPVPAPPRAGPA